MKTTARDGRSGTTRPGGALAWAIVLVLAGGDALGADRELAGLQCHRIMGAKRMKMRDTSLLPSLRPDLAADGCTFSKAKYLCTPSTARIPLADPEELDGPGGIVKGDGKPMSEYVCHEVRCPRGRASVRLSSAYAPDEVKVRRASLVCVPAFPPCVPTTCAAEGASCGPVLDECGKVLNCGTCSEPDTCGGGGVFNVCGAR